MDKDLLKDKSAAGQPFKVPDGYFETLPQRVVDAARSRRKKSLFSIVAPYAAMAASFVLIAAAGSVIIRKSIERRNIESASVYYSQSLGTEQDVSEEDIINYLISSGISCNELNYMQNNE